MARETENGCTHLPTNEESSQRSAAAFKLFRGEESKVGEGENPFMIIAPPGNE